MYRCDCGNNPDPSDNFCSMCGQKQADDGEEELRSGQRYEREGVVGEIRYGKTALAHASMGWYFCSPGEFLHGYCSSSEIMARVLDEHGWKRITTRNCTICGHERPYDDGECSKCGGSPPIIENKRPQKLKCPRCESEKFIHSEPRIVMNNCVIDSNGDVEFGSHNDDAWIDDYHNYSQVICSNCSAEWEDIECLMDEIEEMKGSTQPAPVIWAMQSFMNLVESGNVKIHDLPICPNCGDHNVCEIHSAYISPAKPDEKWVETAARIINEITLGERSESKYAVECCSCGASWINSEEYWRKLCPVCQGTKEVEGEPCKECGATGYNIKGGNSDGSGDS